MNLDKARSNLQRNGYTVEMLYGIECIDEYGYGVEEVLYAESGDEWIEIIRFEKSSVARKFYKMEETEEQCEIDSLKANNKYYEALLKHYKGQMSSDEIDAIEDIIKENMDEIKDIEEDMELFGRSGKYVWYGTKYAIKDTK